jgi:hypothetical protein
MIHQNIRIFQVKPAITTKRLIGVIIYHRITICFGPYGPSSGEYNILPCLLTSPKRYRYFNGSVVYKYVT